MFCRVKFSVFRMKTEQKTNACGNQKSKQNSEIQNFRLITKSDHVAQNHHRV